MNAAWLVILPALVCQADTPIKIVQTDTYVQIETVALQARINKKGYVSGIAAGSFLDKKTGARDAGFGLHIMDFLLGPGWKDDDYGREPKSAPGTARSIRFSKRPATGTPTVSSTRRPARPLRGQFENGIFHFMLAKLPTPLYIYFPLITNKTARPNPWPPLVGQ